MTSELSATSDPDRHSGTTSASRKSNKKVRVNVLLDSHRTVTVTATGLDLDGLIAALSDALASARKAKQLRVKLPTYLQMLADQAHTG